jgi:hypothetical protein
MCMDICASVHHVCICLVFIYTEVHVHVHVLDHPPIQTLTLRTLCMFGLIFRNITIIFRRILHVYKKSHRLRSLDMLAIPSCLATESRLDGSIRSHNQKWPRILKLTERGPFYQVFRTCTGSTIKFVIEQRLYKVHTNSLNCDLTTVP